MIKKPMLAVSLTDFNQLKYPVLATPKLDGIRCLKIDGQALSRKLKPIPNNYIRRWIETYCPDGFDGEIMCTGKTFNETQSLVMTEEGEPDFQYWVFDYVTTILEKSYECRMDDLQRKCNKNKNNTKIVYLFPKIINNLDQLNHQIKLDKIDGYEGTMIRSPNSPYKCGRSTLKEGYLLKIKQFTDAEAEVVGFAEKMKNNNKLERDELGYAKRSSHKENKIPDGTLGKLLVRDLKSGLEFGIGTGYNDQLRLEIWNNQDKYIGKFVTYTYQPSGMKDLPRFPVFKGFRSKNDF